MPLALLESFLPLCHRNGAIAPKEIVILNGVKNLNSFPRTGFGPRSSVVGKDFRPFGKLRTT